MLANTAYLNKYAIFVLRHICIMTVRGGVCVLPHICVCVLTQCVRYTHFSIHTLYVIFDYLVVVIMPSCVCVCVCHNVVCV